MRRSDSPSERSAYEIDPVHFGCDASTLIITPRSRLLANSATTSIGKHDNDVTVKTVDLWKTYVTGQIEYTALRGVSVSVRRGEFVSVVGPSGSGKTTLLNLVGTLDIPSKGEIFLDGEPMSRLDSGQLTLVRRNVLGFVFQSYNLIPHLDALQNIELPLVAAGVPSDERKERAMKLLEQLGLADKPHKKPRELSGGEQQRVAIARALANEPSIILADEPTGNLDSKSAANVAGILRRISEDKNVTVLMVTHNMEIANFSHRIIFLRDGVVEKEVLVN